jgi:hypothetical protein
MQGTRDAKSYKMYVSNSPKSISAGIDICQQRETL